MKIQLFKNGKGLIYGSDPKRIECDHEGVLEIGQIKVMIKPGTQSVMPLIANGSSGEYKATYTDVYGTVYTLKTVTVKKGLMHPPSKTAFDFMELTVRADMLEDRCEKLEDAVKELASIFDTNSLNFLIKN